MSSSQQQQVGSAPSKTSTRKPASLTSMGFTSLGVTKTKNGGPIAGSASRARANSTATTTTNKAPARGGGSKKNSNSNMSVDGEEGGEFVEDNHPTVTKFIEDMEHRFSITSKDDPEFANMIIAIDEARKNCVSGYEAEFISTFVNRTTLHRPDFTLAVATLYASDLEHLTFAEFFDALRGYDGNK